MALQLDVDGDELSEINVTPVLLRADAGLAFGAQMGLLDALRTAGYLSVALVGMEAQP